jgi:hypothetical protein
MRSEQRHDLYWPTIHDFHDLTGDERWISMTGLYQERQNMVAQRGIPRRSKGLRTIIEIYEMRKGEIKMAGTEVPHDRPIP